VTNKSYIPKPFIKAAEKRLWTYLVAVLMEAQKKTDKYTHTFERVIK
jgi:hypothetical protein